MHEISLAYDSEFKNSNVLCITYSDSENTCYIDSSDLNDDFFLPFFYLEKHHQIKAKHVIPSIQIEDIIYKDCQSFINECKDIKTPSTIKKRFGEWCAINEKFRDEILNGGFDGVDLSINKHTGVFRFTPKIKEANQIKINLIAHYQVADIFKIAGKKWQYLLKNTNIDQYRFLSFDSKKFIFSDANNEKYSLQIVPRDTLYIAPIGGGSLDNLCKTFNIGMKVNMEDTPIIKKWLEREKIPLENHAKHVKSNMDIIKKIDFETFKDYALNDSVLCLKLIEKFKLTFNGFYNGVLEQKGNFKMKFSAGANVAEIIRVIVGIEYGSEGVKCMNHHNRETYKQRKENPFGGYTYLVNGGILFNRCASTPTIDGKHVDVDLKSCYGTVIASNLKYYVGKPTIKCYPNYRTKPTLSEFLRFRDTYKSDGYFIRVTGKFKEFTNSLVYSCPDFDNSYEYLNAGTIDSHLNNWQTGKNEKFQKTVRLYAKEIKYGVLTHETIEFVLKALPPNERKEFLSLRLDCVVGYEKDKEVQNIEDYEKGLFFGVELGKYFDRFKTLRESEKYSKKNNKGMNEFLKLVINTCYGVTASPLTSAFNPVYANVITSKVRTLVWAYTISHNGFQPITDGTGVNFNTVPKETYKRAKKVNPHYNIHYVNKGLRFHKSVFNGSENFDQVNKIINEFAPLQMKRFFKCDLPIFDFFTYEVKPNFNGSIIFDRYTNIGSSNYIKHSTNTSVQDKQTHQIFDAKFRSYRFSNEISKYCLDNLNVVTDHFIYRQEDFWKYKDSIQKALTTLNNRDYKSVKFLITLRKPKTQIYKLLTDSLFVFDTIQQREKFMKRYDMYTNIHEHVFMFDDLKEVIKLGFGLEIIPMYSGETIETFRDRLHTYIRSGGVSFSKLLPNPKKLMTSKQINIINIVAKEKQDQRIQTLQTMKDINGFCMILNKSDILESIQRGLKM